MDKSLPDTRPFAPFEWMLAARYLRVLSPQDRGRGQHDIIDLQGTLLTWMREHQVRVVAVRHPPESRRIERSGFTITTAVLW